MYSDVLELTASPLITTDLTGSPIGNTWAYFIRNRSAAGGGFQKTEADNLSALPKATETAMRLYPNPAREQLVVEVPAELLEQSPVLNVYDAFGRLVLTQQANEVQNTVNLETLTPGVYITRVSANNGQVETLRFVKR